MLELLRTGEKKEPGNSFNFTEGKTELAILSLLALFPHSIVGKTENHR